MNNAVEINRTFLDDCTNKRYSCKFYSNGYSMGNYTMGFYNNSFLILSESCTSYIIKSNDNDIIRKKLKKFLSTMNEPVICDSGYIDKDFTEYSKELDPDDSFFEEVKGCKEL